MRRLIDGDALYEKASDLEAQALDYAVKISNDEEKREEWLRWSAILAERTAFKYDVNSAPTIEPERKTGRWIETEGLDEEIRCTMCTNPMRSDRGCDGSCQYDEKLYKQIMSIIKDRIDGGGA